jgi:hypothetical protein
MNQFHLSLCINAFNKYTDTKFRKHDQLTVRHNLRKLFGVIHENINISRIVLNFFFLFFSKISNL